MNPDEFLRLASGRRSIRRFTDKPVPRETILRILEAATWAPSPTNRQGWEFVVVYSSDKKRAMGEAVEAAWERAVALMEGGAVGEGLAEYVSNFLWFAAAPVVVAVAARRPGSFMDNLFGDASADIAGSKASALMAAQNMMLAAHADGLGSCCLTGPLAASLELCRILGVSGKMELVCLVAVGYPAEEVVPLARKPVETVVRFV